MVEKLPHNPSDSSIPSNKNAIKELVDKGVRDIEKYLTTDPIISELTRPAEPQELRRKWDDFEKKYKHDAFFYESEKSDSCLTRIRERVDRRYSAANLIELQQLISLELLDVRNQRTDFLKNHP